MSLLFSLIHVLTSAYGYRRESCSVEVSIHLVYACSRDFVVLGHFLQSLMEVLVFPEHVRRRDY